MAVSSFLYLNNPSLVNKYERISNFITLFYCIYRSSLSAMPERPSHGAMLGCVVQSFSNHQSTSGSQELVAAKLRDVSVHPQDFLKNDIQNIVTMDPNNSFVLIRSNETRGNQCCCCCSPNCSQTILSSSKDNPFLETYSITVLIYILFKVPLLFEFCSYHFFHLAHITL